jgi:hypothetical protein
VLVHALNRLEGIGAARAVCHDKNLRIAVGARCAPSQIEPRWAQTPFQGLEGGDFAAIGRHDQK